jgi:sugar/nucleoside kinase (ribokinase family)
MRLDLIDFGEFYNDFIFHGLPRVPRLGEEMRAPHFARSVGGGAAITAVAARRQGLRVGLVTVVGDGAELDPLRAEKIDLRHAVVDPRGRTAITVAVSTRRDRYFLTCEGANRQFESFFPGERLYPYLKSARHVHVCYQPRGFRTITELMGRLRAAGVSTSIDFGWHPKITSRPGFWKWLAAATIFFPNLMEARALTGRRRPEEALARLAGMVTLPVIKLGSEGAIAWQHGRVLHAPSPRVKVVDSTGAGDAFNGGFLAAFLQGRPVQECLERGNACAARSVAAPGGVAGL